MARGRREAIRRALTGSGALLLVAAPLAGGSALAAAPPPSPTPSLSVPAPGTLPVGPPTPGASAASASPPLCPNAVQVIKGTQTSAPQPLPPPTGTVGGARLALQGRQLSLAAGTPQPPVVAATAWIVTDLDSGAVLASCNAHVQEMPASTLKILTALALGPGIVPTAHYIGRPEDAAVDGTKVGISPGSIYTGNDLLHALMLDSGNDAATALAQMYGGLPKAVAAMTAKAQALGAFDTRPLNTSGLDAPGQVTSVYDLAVLGRAALGDPVVSRLVATKYYQFPGKGLASGPARKTFQIANHNRLLFSYPGADGVKNGFTENARGSFVGSARRDTRHYLVAVLRAQGSTPAMAAQLLDWAFANGRSARPVGRLVTAADVQAHRLDGAVGALPGPAATPTPSVTGSPTATGGTTGGTSAATPPVASPEVAAAGARGSGSGFPVGAAVAILVGAGAFGAIVGGLTTRRR